MVVRLADLSWATELRERLEALLGSPVELDQAHLLAGGASKEAWAVDVSAGGAGLELLVRRAGGGVIHADTLSLEHEYRVLEAAHEAGVRVPRPYGYLGELGGREAFATERVEGETIGRRIVSRPELAEGRRALPLQLAEELAKVHSIAPAEVPFLRAGDVLERFEHELDSVGEPHPAIELGLRWLREHRPEPLAPVVCHGDFRIGNVVVSERGLSTCSTGSSRTSAIRARTSPGRSSAPGASAPTNCGSAASATSSRTSSATAS